MSRNRFVAAALALIAGGAAFTLANRSPAQNAPGALVPELAEDSPAIRPPMDRTLSQGIERARQSLAAGEFTQPLRYLDEVLGRDEDVFVQTGDGNYVGLKATARAMIRDLPAAGRQAYESAYGPVAERMLRQAVQSEDSTTLLKIVQRYFHTAAGMEAAVLAAASHADAGRSLAAALLYDDLLSSSEAITRFEPGLSIRAAACWIAAGDERRATAILADLKRRGHENVEVAARRYDLPRGEETPVWLAGARGPRRALSGGVADWTTYRGDAQRSNVTQGGLPHMRVRWQVPLIANYLRLERLFNDMSVAMANAGEATSVASAPIAVGDYVLVRTPHELLAVDFRTGKRVWRSEPQRDPQLEQLLSSGSEERSANPDAARSFMRRVWEDYLYGVISSDGERVYAIRDVPMSAAPEYDVAPFIGGSIVEAPPASNRLCAYELSTQGKLVWEIDGATTEGGLAGSYFLGAPLAVGRSLYVMLEIKGAIYLAAVDRETGDLQWRQQLANLETGVLMDTRRRLQAAMPSFDAGVLVCPTGAGLIVGIDLARQSLAWAYRHGTAATPDDVYPGRAAASSSIANRWTDGPAVIADGRVFITPPQSPDLHCLDLRTGRLLWKKPRQEMRQLACVDKGRALLIGPETLMAVDVKNGKPAWNKPLEFAGGARPSGAGFSSNGSYYLPLTTGEVAAIDMAAGRIEAVAASRDGAQLGNLICHRGSVISQNGLALDCFDQIDVLRRKSERRLANDPEDAEALRTLGEVAFNEGRLSEAIALLERAHRADADDMETSETLAECLQKALDDDFAAYRSRLPLLNELASITPGRRLSILRIESEGLLSEHEPLASAKICLEFYRAASSTAESVQVSRTHECGASSWAAAQMLAVWEAADPEERLAIERLVLTEAESAEAEGGPAIERFLEIFGELGLSEQIQLRHAARLAADGMILESQQELLRLARSKTLAVRAEAVARLSAGLHEVSQPQLAAAFDRQLAGPLANVECLESKTGRQLLDERPPAVSRARWPEGKVDVRVGTVSVGGRSAAPVRGQLRPVRLERTDEVLGGANVFLAPQPRGAELFVRDGYGRDVFNVTLDEANPSQYRPVNAYAVSRGSLLVTSMGRQITAVNTLASSAGAEPILWRSQLNNRLDFAPGYFDELGAAMRRPGTFRAARTSDRDKWIGVIGPVTNRGCIFQDQQRLVCVDAMTGEVRWSRSDVPPNCDLFGDERYVIVAPQQREGTAAAKARVYSSIDGREVAETTIPSWLEQLATRGRHFIRWHRNEDARWELSAVEYPSRDVPWRHVFDPGAAIDIDQNRYVAVAEPRGRITIVDLDSGETAATYSGSPLPSVREIHLTASIDGFVLVADLGVRGNPPRAVKPLQPMDSAIVTGKVFFFDRTAGEMRWSRPADVVQQGLLISQGAELPFIAFAAAALPDDGSSQRMAASLLILDKATGRTLYATDELPLSTMGICTVRVEDAAAGQASVELSGHSILLQYTNARRPPEPPAMAEVESPGDRSSRGVIGIFMNLGEDR